MATETPEPERSAAVQAIADTFPEASRAAERELVRRFEPGSPEDLADQAAFEAERDRQFDRAYLVRDCTFRVNEMLGRRAVARSAAVQKGTRRPDAIMAFWVFEQHRFHRWLCDRFEVTVGEVNRVAIAQARLERQAAERLRHHAPAHVREQLRAVQAAGAAA